jgi:hypothetical protein
MIELNFEKMILTLNITNLLLINMYIKQDYMNELFDLILFLILIKKRN